MTYVIASPCIDVLDQSCVEVCPVDCIHVETEDRMCFIEPNDCIDCGVCEPACPVGAIFRDNELPQDAAEFERVNLLWFEDKDAARAEVDRLADSSVL